jgi:hypothetical protein
VAVLFLVLGAGTRLLALADAFRYFVRWRRPLVVAAGSSVVGSAGVDNSEGRGAES